MSASKKGKLDTWVVVVVGVVAAAATYGGLSLHRSHLADEAAAQQTVMDACRKTISDCRLLASGEGGCVATAIPPARTTYFGGWGPTRDDAEAAAVANSAGGTVLKDHTHCQGDPTS